MTPAPLFKFRLFVADDAPNSRMAIFNLDAICQTHLAGRYETEVVDVLLDAKQALADRIFMTPTLVRLSPGPPLRIVGTLSHTPTVLQALGLRETVA